MRTESDSERTPCREKTKTARRTEKTAFDTREAKTTRGRRSLRSREEATVACRALGRTECRARAVWALGGEEVCPSRSYLRRQRSVVVVVVVVVVVAVVAPLVFVVLPLFAFPGWQVLLCPAALQGNRPLQGKHPKAEEVPASLRS